ncbi:MAG TPA: sulfite exporter TauE/SafE family protein [Acidimicrobiales bacterium]|nr:sulfite exporter TauE/SafE family protein [Acidimicrobiales bacterium]
MSSQLIFVAIAGFCASFVDGALGMGFGPTSSTILLSSGLSPASASTVVNLAKVATGVAAAVSHWRFQNIDHRLVRKLAIPGALGALVGVTVLANVDGKQIRPMLAALLMAVGIRILIRFSAALPVTPATAAEEAAGTMPAYNEKGVMLGAAAGGVTNGLIGAWGPVVTPMLLHKGLPARFAIGSTNTAEVAVAVVASGSLLASLGGEGVDPGVVIAMLLGGVTAAPIAAWSIKFIPPRALGIAVSALLLFTNARELAGHFELGATRWLAYAAVAVVCTLAGLRPRFRPTRPVAAAPSLAE